MGGGKADKQRLLICQTMPIFFKTYQPLIAFVMGILSISGAIFAIAILPYRVTSAETRLEKVESKQVIDHDINTEIRERLKAIQEQLNRLEKTK